MTTSRTAVRRSRSQAVALTAVIAVLIVVAVLGFLGPDPQGRGAEAQRRQIQLATSDAVSALMTFAPQTLTEQQRTVGPRLTGRLLLEFRSQGPGVVLPTAVQSGAQMSTDVVATAVNRMSSDSARVLVFANQNITLPAADPPQEVVPVTRWADMRKVDGNWLLAGLQPVGPG